MEHVGSFFVPTRRRFSTKQPSLQYGTALTGTTAAIRMCHAVENTACHVDTRTTFQFHFSISLVVTLVCLVMASCQIFQTFFMQYIRYRLIYVYTIGTVVKEDITEVEASCSWKLEIIQHFFQLQLSIGNTMKGFRFFFPLRVGPNSSADSRRCTVCAGIARQTKTQVSIFGFHNM
jgi:hypothetical protein